MDIKSHINKIHFDLSSTFDEVTIQEKSSLKFGSYFEISNISEGKELKMIITKKDIESPSFNWFYLANPLNESSDLIERTSDINNISIHAKEIVTKNRFNEEYLNQINK
jgi:hypothetical protein